MNTKHLILTIAFLAATLFGISLFFMKGFEMKLLVPTMIFAALTYFFFSNIKES